MRGVQSVSFDNSHMARTSSESRPENIGVLYCIKTENVAAEEVNAQETDCVSIRRTMGIGAEFKGSASGKSYSWSSVVDDSSTNGAPGLTCKYENGWKMTGCTAGDNGDADNDHTMFGNRCLGDPVDSSRNITIRCCNF